MTTIRQILSQKGRKVWSISQDLMVIDALKMMADKNIGSLAVMNGDKFVGIVTERHYAREVFLKGRASPTTAIRDIMTTSVVCAKPDQSVEECMALMTEKRIRHLPVIEGNDVVGLVSIGDLVKSIISDQEFTISQLEHYVHG
jgi:CBS domain-containing protein